MIRIAAAAVALVSSLAFAQEIGKEIPSDQTTPPPSATPSPTYDNPYAPAPTPPPPPPEAKAPGAVDRVPGPKKGAFGLRAELGGARAGIGSSSLGFAAFVTDSVALTFELGTGLDFTAGTFGFASGLGAEIHLGNPEKPIRPFVALGASFGKPVTKAGDDFMLGFNVGGGAQYWFNDHFAMNGRALLDLPIDLKKGSAAMATITPGIGGTFYF